MTDKFNKGKKPLRMPDEVSFTEAFDVEDIVAEPEVEAAEEVVAVVASELTPAPVLCDPLTAAQQEAETVARMISEARANAAKKNVVTGAANAEKTAAIERRKEELQKKIDSLYTVGEWAGKPNYECTECSYATLDESLIRQHVIKHIG
jgi:rubrerythrin